MAPSLDELRSELTQNPADFEIVRRWGEACLRARDVEAFRGGLGELVSGLADPGAARPMASTLAATVERAAEDASASEAVELYLRAAEIHATLADDPQGAARAIAAAWRLQPDERLSRLAQRILGEPSVDEAPPWLLIAWSQVGAETVRVEAMRRLAAAALDDRDPNRAEALYHELQGLQPDDAEAQAGLVAIEALRDAARATIEAAERQTATASGADAVAAWTRLAEARREAGDVSGAEAAYREALQRGSTAATEAGLEALLREQGRLDELAAFLRERLSDAPRERQAFLRRRLYHLLQRELGREEEARALLALAPPAVSRDAAELLERARAVGRGGDWEGAVHALEEAVSHASSRDLKVEILTEQGRILEETMRDLEGAERAFRRVRAADPRNTDALAFYRRWLAERDEPRRAHANLVQLHAALDGPELAAERKDVARELAHVAEHDLASADKAIDAWRKVLDDDPGDEDARAALKRLYEETSRWHSLVDHLESWIAALPEDAVAPRVDLLFAMIEVFSHPERLPMDGMVIRTYQRIVALSPGDVRALDGLASTLARSERWSELAQVLARKVELTTKPEELLDLFHQIADLTLDHIRSESQAIPVLERILEIDPTDVYVIHRLRDIYRRRHDSERLYATYERELPLLRGAERLEVLVELATLATDPLFKPDQAVAWWRQVLALEPRHEKARQALQDLHAEQADWDGYVALLEERLNEAKTRKQRVEVLLELGETLYTRIGDEARAQEIFTQIAEQSPFNTTARQFLQRLYVSRRAWDELQTLYAPRDDWRGYVALLQDYAERSTQPFIASEIHREVARVLDDHLGDPAGALRHLELALAAAPERADVARQLVVRYPANARPGQRIPALIAIANHTEEPAERRKAWRDLAQAYTSAGDAQSAFKAWCKAVVVDAGLGGAESIAALEESAAAANVWGEAYAALGDALARLPEAAPEARIRYHRSLGAIASQRLTQGDDAVRHYRWVLQLAPGDEAALEALERIHLSRQDFAALEEVYRARADAAVVPEERVAALFQLGRLYEDILVDGPRAAAIYQEILGLAPDNADATDAALRVLELEELWGDLASLLETVVSRSDDPSRRAELQRRLAGLYARRLDQPVAAVDHLRDVVDGGPPFDTELVTSLEGLLADGRARGAAAAVLEGVYRVVDDPERLVGVLVVRLEEAEVLPDRLRLLDEIAMLGEAALADPNMAFNALLERFGLAPGDRDVWGELLRLAGVTSQWDRLAEVWSERVARGVSADLPVIDLAALRLALADVLHTHLIEVDAAVDQVERAIAEGPEERELLAAWERLEVLYKKAADLDGYVRAKRAASELVISQSKRRKKLLDAAYVLAGPLGRLDEAVALGRALFDEDPADWEMGEALLRLLDKRGDAEGMDALYAARIELEADAERRDSLAFRRALLRRDSLGQWELAIDGLIDLIPSESRGYDARQGLLEVARARESAAQRDVILEALDAHYRGEGDAEGQLAVLLVRVDFADPGPARSAAFAAAAAVCLPDLGKAPEDPEKAQNAFDLLTQALHEDPAAREVLDRLVALGEALEVPAALLDALEACGDKAGVSPAAMPIWSAAAKVAEGGLGDGDRAIAAWRQQLAIGDEHPELSLGEALGHLDRLLVDRPEERVGVLERMREEAPDPGAGVEILMSRARLLEGLGRTDEAIDDLTEGLAIASGADEEGMSDRVERLFTWLETLLTGAGRHAEVVDLLLRQADAASDDDDRRLATYRAAEVAAERAEDLRRATRIYRDLLAWSDRDEIALSQLVVLYGELSEWAAQAGILEHQLTLAEETGDDALASGLRLQLGRLYATELGDPARAIACYEAVLAGAPTAASALEALEVLAGAAEQAPEARRVLAGAYRAVGDHVALARILEASAAADDPSQTPAARHDELAALYRLELDDPEAAWPHACAAYEAAPRTDGADARREALVALGASLERLPEAAMLLLEIAGEFPERDERRARRLEDLEALRAAGLEESLALPFWLAILDDSPGDRVVLGRLEDHARHHKDEELLIDALERRIAATEGEGDKAAARLELAQLIGREPARTDEAEGVLRAILAHDATEREAFLALVRLHVRGKRWEKLAVLYEERLAIATADEEIASLRKRLARVRWQHLGDARGAVTLYEAVLAADPDDEEALAKLEGLWGEGLERARIFPLLEPRYEAGSDRDKLIALYASAIDSDDEPELQELCLARMARLELVQLGRPDAAYATMKVLVERLEDPEPRLDELEQLAERAGRWEDLVAYYESRVAGGRATSALMARLAGALDARAGDVERAIHFYRFALDRDPSDADIRVRLEALLRRTGRWEDLVALALASADGVEDGEERIALWFSAAEILVDELERPMDAVDVLERIVDARTEDPAAHEMIVSLLERVGDHEALHEHYRRWIEQAPTDEQAVALQVRLGASMTRFTESVRDGLVELDAVMQTTPVRADALVALEEMLVRAEEAELRGDTIEPLMARATADAAEMLARAQGEQIEPRAQARIVAAELRVLRPGAERQATLVRLGELRSAANEPARAFDSFAEALLGDIGNEHLDAALSSLALEHDLWDRLVDLCQRCAEAPRVDEGVVQRYTLRVAEILEHHLGRHEESVSWYERLLERVPSSREAIEPLAKHYRAGGDGPSEARILAQWIEQAAQPEETPALLKRLAALRMDELGDAVGAIDALELTLPESATEPDVISRLERLYAGTRSFDRLVELYQIALAAAETPAGELPLLAKLAQVAETRLDDLETARDACLRMLEIDPAHGFALTSLERVERAREDWEAVDDAIARRVAAASSPDARAKLLVDRAIVAAQRRGRPEDALALMDEADGVVGPGEGTDHLVAGYESLLRHESTRLEAARRLQRRYRARKAWPRLINAMLIEHRATVEPEERVTLVVRASEVAEQRLDDLDAALRVLLTGLRLDPGSMKLRRLIVDLAERGASWAPVIQVGGELLGAAEDGELIRELGLWLGPLQRDRVDDPEGAVGSFERVLEVDATNSVALAALEELYALTDDWRGRRRLLERSIEASHEEAERERLLLELARLILEHEATAEAVPVLRDVLEMNPANAEAVELLTEQLADPRAGRAAAEVLEPIHRATEDWPALVALLETRARATESPDERAALWRGSGVVHEEWLKDRITALKHFARAVHAAPDDRAGLRQFERLGFGIGAWDEVVRVLSEVHGRMKDRAMQRDALLHMAQIRETRLQDLDQAAADLRQVLAIEPGHRGAIAGLRRLHRARGDVEAFEAATVELSRIEPRAELVRKLWDEVYVEGAQAGDEDRMIRACLRMLELSSEDREAAQRLLPLYRARGYQGEVAGLIEMLAASEGDPAQEARLRVELARQREQLGDEAGAIEAYEEAWELDPTLMEVAERLQERYRQGERWNSLASLLAALIEGEDDPSARARLRLELGAIQAHAQGNDEGAIVTYRRVLDDAPEEFGAHDALIALYARRRRFAELGDVLRRKAEAQHAPVEARGTLVRAAVVYLDQVEDTETAAGLLDRVLGDDPHHPEAMLAKARLETRRGRPRVAVELLSALLTKVQPKRRFNLLVELARVHSELLDEPEVALAHALEARRLEQETPALRRLLRDLLLATGRWQELAQLLAAEFSGVSDARARSDRALELARLHHEHTGDDAQCAEWLARAESADPESLEAAELFVEHLSERERWSDLAPRLERLVDLLQSQHEVEELPRRAHELGRLRERLGDPARARQAYRVALEADATYLPNLIDYGRLLVAEGAWDDALRLHQTLLMQSQRIEDPAVRHDVLYHLALASLELGQATRARQYVMRLAQAAPAHHGLPALRARIGS